ncbi:histidine kinase [Natronomonas halophila]|uniref:DICT sensory domain-containing protein n=1 Tax=Natronomonas halophila TaxID=2747817 RepID=UPI0015B543F1|nr:histidine kinase [Natronomonas halophila]QLD86168.1 histidine kinase [Natronomonas halophila]
MSADLPDTLGGFIDEVGSAEKTLLLVNRTGPEPLVNLLDNAFQNQTVAVAERQIPEGVDDLVCLVDDGEMIATTPFWRLKEAFLLVNVDRYRTGTRQSEQSEFPAVLTGLGEIEFTVRGFPVSNKEKLLLVLISRFIENRALTRGDGELHSTFQRLSRLDDEYGTRSMYERLASSTVETHVYGIRDDPEMVDALAMNVHSDRTDEYRRSWVVAFSADGETVTKESGEGHAALVAIETGPNVWRAMWTYDANRVDRIQAYLRQFF